VKEPYSNIFGRPRPGPRWHHWSDC